MKTYNTQDITDIDIDQIILSRDSQTGQVWIRANVIGKLVNTSDAKDTQTINVAVKELALALGVGQAVLAIRNAVLTSARTKI